MSSDADKIQTFIKLIEENPDNCFADHWQSLTELQNQLSDDDEKNVEAVENWLKADRAPLQQAYTQKLSSINPLLGATGEKGGFGGKAKPKQSSPSLRELIEQAAKKNTSLGNSPAQKPPSQS
ncbi:hypothetical protein [Coleofasciculus sp.]|uniref:hypothetical protein n=1 Tax=Coleofasciculus sp. TaxID=3100458 RepID=UPI003A1315FC